MERLIMYDKLPLPPLRENIKFWNKTAIDCYEINCNCDKCFLYTTFFKNKNRVCYMKYYVFYMIKKLGKPKECSNTEI